jgi:hypothetical protein
VSCLWIEGNFVSQGFRFLLPNWLGCHCIFHISGIYVLVESCYVWSLTPRISLSLFPSSVLV